MNKLRSSFQIISNMGWNYVLFRTGYELQRRSGLLKRKFPTSFKPLKFISVAQWLKTRPAFIFNDRSNLTFQKNKHPKLKQFYTDFLEGKLPFFSNEVLSIGRDYDWMTNTKSGFTYDGNQHWTAIDDLSSEAGDIKYVWEKSRFCYLTSLIRYDYHFEKDLAGLTFQEIESWINANRPNCGPNFRCSQEISIRLFHWIFALYYYGNSEHLTDDRFNLILNSIYQQAAHVYHNIQFSRKSVRNNHAITETLALYIVGLLFPFFPQAAIWKRKGKSWFEQEIRYQIYEDGTYLQFSHNYHRVVIQLLTWAFSIARANKESFAEDIYEKGSTSLDVLIQHQDRKTGWLPNYGTNDGSLFFQLNNCDYRDFRPQLNALYYFYHQQNCYEDNTVHEDACWFFVDHKHENSNLKYRPLASFKSGGFYTMRDTESLTSIRCGKHKDRPAHADNLHLDIWYKGKNLLLDAGSYSYNTSPELMRYFNGTAAHNTLQIADLDQMHKGPRFIWLNWSQAIEAQIYREEGWYVFEGSIQAFGQLRSDIFHRRIVRKKIDEAIWIIEDWVNEDLKLPISQNWHTLKKYQDKIMITAIDGTKQELPLKCGLGWYASYYGAKEESITLTFQTKSNYIKTKIELSD